MRPDEIKARLRQKGLRQSDLCRRWEVAACTVHALVHRKFKSARLERNLARVLGVTVAELRGEQHEREAS